MQEKSNILLVDSNAICYVSQYSMQGGCLLHFGGRFLSIWQVSVVVGHDGGGKG